MELQCETRITRHVTTYTRKYVNFYRKTIRYPLSPREQRRGVAHDGRITRARATIQRRYETSAVDFLPAAARADHRHRGLSSERMTDRTASLVRRSRFAPTFTATEKFADALAS